MRRVTINTANRSGCSYIPDLPPIFEDIANRGFDLSRPVEMQVDSLTGAIEVGGRIVASTAVHLGAFSQVNLPEVFEQMERQGIDLTLPFMVQVDPLLGLIEAWQDRSGSLCTA